MEVKVAFWIWFNVFVLVMLALDLGVFHRKRKEISVRDALMWTGIWFGLALVFSGLVYYWSDKHRAMEFLTGYLVEKTLSLDNIFVFALIFTHFAVAPENQHKILFWGIVGALLMRAAFIMGGIALLHRFHFMVYVFSAILIYTGVRIFLKKHRKIKPEKNLIIRFLLNMLPFSTNTHGGKFFVRENGKRYATKLFMVLLVVELTDIMFAADSIPAILAITQDSFIVYTSNVFAMLGLRSLYFALAGVIDKFIYLQTALAVMLVFIGLKMIAQEFLDIPIYYTFLLIVAILGTSIVLSVRKSRMISRRS